MKIRMLLKVGFLPIVLYVYLVSKLHMQILKRDWLIIDYSPNQACVVKSNYEEVKKKLKVWSSQYDYADLNKNSKPIQNASTAWKAIS